VVVLGLAVVAAVLVVVFVSTSSKPPPATRATAVLHTLFKLPSASAVAEGDGAGFATDDLRSLLVSFDPSTGHQRGSVHLMGRPVALLLLGRDLWVADMVSDTVQEVDARSLKVVRSVAVPAGPSGLAVLGGQIWVSSLTAGSVSPIDPANGHVGSAVPVPGGAVRIAAGFGALWLTGTTDQLTEVQPGGAEGIPLLHAISTGTGPIGVTTGLGSVWVANAAGGTVARVDPATRRVIHTYRTGGDPLALAVSGGRLWLADGSAERLRTLFPAPGVGPVELASSPRALLAVGSQMWIATANPGRVVEATVSRGP
jgi:DNA-binding beta-propeller fold protein YncE